MISPLRIQGAAHVGEAWVVSSGKGGVGTSTVAALLGLAASRAGAPALIVDGDVQFGVQHLLFGLPPSPGLAALGGGSADPLSLPVPVAEGLMVLCGGPSGDGPPPTGVELAAAFRRTSPLLRAFGASVIDAGSRHATVSAALSASGGRLLAVCRHERVSIAATYALIKHVWARDADRAVQVIVNGADAAQGQIAFQSISNACERFLGRTPGFAGIIPEDPALREQLGEGVGIQFEGGEGPARNAARFVESQIRARGLAVADPGARMQLGRM